MSIQHQDIETNSIVGQTVRQARFNDLNYIDLVISNKKVTLLNYSAYGFAFISEHKYQVGDTIHGCQLLVYGKEIADCNGVVRRCNLNANNQYEIGVEIIDGELDINSIHTLYDIQTKIAGIYEKENRYKSIPSEITASVRDLVGKLQAFESIAKNIEATKFNTKNLTNVNYRLAVENLGAYIYKELSGINAKIQSTFYNLTDTEKKICLEYYRENVGSYVLQSNFTNRSYSKPLGYAGDYEMMNQLYRNDNFSHTLFGSCVEYAVNLHDEPGAVRNRAQYLSEKIVNLVNKNAGKKIRILAVACGPAQEIKTTIQKLSQEQLSQLEIVLLDQDQNALLYAQQNIKAELIETGKKLNFQLMNKSIKEIIMSGLTDEFDLIYSAGLFDYFTDAVAKRASRSLLKVLKASGELIIGNFNISSPNWFGMLALFDWQLILRGEQDLQRIFSSENISVVVESEARNVNLFCIIRKNG